MKQSDKAAARAGRSPVCDGPMHIVKNVPYGPHCGQNLDLYLPVSTGFPVVVYVHGGSWIAEDKAMYETVGRYFAVHGVGAVLLNYRLPPEADIQIELQDAVSGVVWTSEHIACFGGDTGRLFLCGHSSGGHIVSVLGTDPEWLAGSGLSRQAIRGVISVSGVYSIGINVRSFGVGYLFRWTDLSTVNPEKQICGCPPPFLLVCAQHDFRYVKVQARRFSNTLRHEGGVAYEYIVANEDHYGQILDIARLDDPLGARLLRFVLEN